MWQYKFYKKLEAQISFVTLTLWSDGHHWSRPAAAQTAMAQDKVPGSMHTLHPLSAQSPEAVVLMWMTTQQGKCFWSALSVCPNG